MRETDLTLSKILKPVIFSLGLKKFYLHVKIENVILQGTLTF